MARDEQPVEGSPLPATPALAARDSRGRSAVDVARRVLARVETGAYATLTLSGELERSGLSEPGRALCTELVYGCLRRQARVDRALAAHAPRGLSSLDLQVRVLLRLAAYQLLFTRVPPPLAVSQTVDIIGRLRGPGLAGFANALLRRLAREGEPPSLPLPGLDASDAEFTAALAEKQALPQFLVGDVVTQLGRDEAAALCEALEAPAPVWLRLNALRGPRAEALAALTRDGIDIVEAPALSDVPEAIRLKRGNPFTSAAFGEGWFTGQDLGAQLVTRLLVADSPDGIPALPDGPLLDACAGVGGKTTHLAALTENRRDIDAADRSGRKLELCTDHAHRLGCHRVRTVEVNLLEGGALASQLRSEYAAVLLDAPCSGVGVLRRHPEARRRLTLDQVQELCSVQQKLLGNLAPYVRRGGILVYAVCSFLTAEGSAQAAAFLRDHPEFRALGELRTFPHRQDADGFYAARFLRT